MAGISIGDIRRHCRGSWLHGYDGYGLYLSSSLFIKSKTFCEPRARDLSRYFKIIIEHNHKKTSRLISSVLTGYLSSNLSRTVGCKIPNSPIRTCFPPSRRYMAAA